MPPPAYSKALRVSSETAVAMRVCSVASKPIAAVLYRDFSRQRDDVTVVVGKEVA